VTFSQVYTREIVINNAKDRLGKKNDNIKEFAHYLNDLFYPMSDNNEIQTGMSKLITAIFNDMNKEYNNAIIAMEGKGDINLSTSFMKQDTSLD
jgi:hypothetical protein